VILLPNNPNVIMAAQRAAESCAKRVRILPTLSAAVGVTAALAYDPNAPFERNTEEMEGAVASAHGIELTLAVRDAEIGRVRAREGEYVALLDDELVAAGPQLPAVLVAALELASPEEKELLTLYTGRDADPGEAEEAARAVRNRWPELEVDVHVGGQPHYPLVASIE
jgi:dihydroxyacetone kinase-like predicted kinase